jgi:hypothetical protein
MHHLLLRIVFRLRHCVRPIQEKSHDFFEDLVADIHSAVKAIGRFYPILADSNLPRLSFSAVAPQMATSIAGPIPQGGIVHARLVTPLSSATAKKREPVEVALSQPLMDGNRLVLPQGSRFVMRNRHAVSRKMAGCGLRFCNPVLS